MFISKVASVQARPNRQQNSAKTQFGRGEKTTAETLTALNKAMNSKQLSLQDGAYRDRHNLRIIKPLEADPKAGLPRRIAHTLDGGGFLNFRIFVLPHSPEGNQLWARLTAPPQNQTR